MYRARWFGLGRSKNPSAPPVKVGFYIPLEAGKELDVTVHVAGGQCGALSALRSAADRKQMANAWLKFRIFVDVKDLGQSVSVGSLWALPLKEKTFTFQGLLVKDMDGVVTDMRRLRVAQTGADPAQGVAATSAQDAVGTIRVDAFVVFSKEVTIIVPPPPPSAAARAGRGPGRPRATALEKAVSDAVGTETMRTSAAGMVETDTAPTQTKAEAMEAAGTTAAG